MPIDLLRQQAPFWSSVLIGLALWEIAGRSASAAFIVPFSATLVRLWELAVAGQLGAQMLDSARLFIAGLSIALLVGGLLGLLLGRMHALRSGLEPFLMALYATPMVAL